MEWTELELKDLFYAYRKAKADCYFERVVGKSIEFADYEIDLVKNLNNLLLRLKGGEIKEILTENISHYKLIPKKLTVKNKKEAPTQTHCYFSDARRALKKIQKDQTLSPEFRLVGDFPVEMHILSALWINMVGHIFDAQIPANAYGSRLRRYKSVNRGQVGDFQLQAVGSFQPYFQPYKKWREDGLNAIRQELNADKAVIAISMDITSYYHSLSPKFLSNPKYWDKFGVKLHSPIEREFTELLTSALALWGDNVTEEMIALGCDGEQISTGGIPIGLSASRVISNIYLQPFDRDIVQELSPVFYGRYVDDIFLVIRDPGNLFNTNDVFNYINKRSKFLNNTGEYHSIKYDIEEDSSTLVLQPKKQKVFFLKGQGGIDLLDNIDTQIREVSSERRLMPSPDQLNDMTAAKVLSASSHPSEEADTLRRADGLSIRRLSWSVLLRSVETIARDLPKAEWRAERKRFYDFSHDHILRPDKILDHFDYVPRLLSIAVKLSDWTDARRMYEQALEALRGLENASNGEIIINNIPQTKLNNSVWIKIQKQLASTSADAVVKSIPRDENGRLIVLTQTAVNFCKTLNIGSSLDEIKNKSDNLTFSDLGALPFKSYVRKAQHRSMDMQENEKDIQDCYEYIEQLRDFLASSGFDTLPSKSDDTTVTPSLIPYLFPTRPFTPEELTELLPKECVFGDTPEKKWATFAQAVRGVWVWPTLTTTDPLLDQLSYCADGPVHSEKLRYARIGGIGSIPEVILGITSFETEDISFSKAASNDPDLSRNRYERIEKIVNLAINTRPRITHLLLPELSLPEKWLKTVSNRLGDVGISLIVGLDYKHNKEETIYSEAAVVLRDNRLGFPTAVHVRQKKGLPAPSEDRILRHIYGKIWCRDAEKEKKIIFNHAGFNFSLLVCSELQNIEHRFNFQGEVDCMMILSWNQDIETFSSLVESSTLDVHSYVALVNNRKYGDSRVRSPAKQNYARDLCRVKGGKNDQLVAVSLDLAAIRAFQSRANRWPDADDLFKPVPEGFRIAARRKTLPS